MDTLLKYVFYLALIFIVYLVIVGFYDGRLNGDSTVSEVGSEVSSNAQRIISETYDDAARVVKEQSAKTPAENSAAAAQ